jgi:hypothetical protein
MFRSAGGGAFVEQVTIEAGGQAIGGSAAPAPRMAG